MATDSTLNFCPTCGEAARTAAHFCAKCGTAFDAYVATPVAAGAPTRSAETAAYAYSAPAPQPSAPPAPNAASFGSPVPRQPLNGMAIASMVLGIVWIYWVGSILALVFGYVAKRQIAESNGRESGDGMATAGIALGWVGVGVLVLIVLLAAVHSGSQS